MTPDAVFIGYQKDLKGKPLFALYNVVKQGHPLYRSTVSEKTLREQGLKVPADPHSHQSGEGGISAS